MQLLYIEAIKNFGFYDSQAFKIVLGGFSAIIGIRRQILLKFYK